jgi:hypothetical protein
MGNGRIAALESGCRHFEGAVGFLSNQTKRIAKGAGAHIRQCMSLVFLSQQAPTILVKDAVCQTQSANNPVCLVLSYSQQAQVPLKNEECQVSDEKSFAANDQVCLVFSYFQQSPQNNVNSKLESVPVNEHVSESSQVVYSIL